VQTLSKLRAEAEETASAAVRSKGEAQVGFAFFTTLFCTPCCSRNTFN
jgi:hypothetical protein